MTAAPADLARIVTAPWREVGWVLRVLPDHRVEMVHDGKVLDSKPMSDTASALLYAHAVAASLKAPVVAYGCGGCGPMPGPYRCVRCKELDVLADRRNDERTWT